MNARVFKPLAWLGILVLIVSLACNLGASQTATPAPTEAPAKAPPPTEEVIDTPAPSPQANTGEVSSREDVQKAVIRIVSQGSFVDPEFGSYEGIGSGSGFIIDPSGIAITNNHVVTGAALIKVYFSDDDKPRNAKILGVSECSDLAVIDIDGDGFYLGMRRSWGSLSVRIWL